MYFIHRRPELPCCLDNYYLAFSKDPPRVKILVYAVYAAELVQTILFSQMAFKEFAAGFGSFEALDEVGNFWFAVPILSSTGMFWVLLVALFRFLTSKLVAFVVQIFYARNIKLLLRSNFIAAVVVLVKIAFFITSRMALLYVEVRLDPTRRRNWTGCTCSPVPPYLWRCDARHGDAHWCMLPKSLPSRNIYEPFNL